MENKKKGISVSNETNSYLYSSDSASPFSAIQQAKFDQYL
jgi:hypothetical protein